MTVSARHSAVAIILHDAVFQREFPYAFTLADPGVGSGGSASVALETSAGVRALAWPSYGNPSVASGHFPPAGDPAQPSASAIQNALKWWPQGFHHYVGTSWSRNFGFVASLSYGPSPNGDIVPIVACYQGTPRGTYTWRFLAYSSLNNPSNPYAANANAIWQHLGYDVARRKDLALLEDTPAGGSDFLQVYEISAAIPTVRGVKVWQGTNGDRALGRTFKTEGGQQRIQLPWLGQWWVIQYSQSQSSIDQVWAFAPTASPASSSSSTPAGFAVTVPANVRSIAQANGGELHFVVDQMNRRVFAYQADTTQPVQVIGGVNKYPLALYEVNPATYAWAPVTLATVLRVAIGTKINLAPMAYFGGAIFKYFDQRTNNNIYYGEDLDLSGVPPDVSTIPGQPKKTGGFYVREIFIPKATMPRTMTWTQRSWSGVAANTLWTSQKHVEMTFRPADGKMYCFGGDHGAFTLFGDATLSEGSYTNQVLSFTPESGSDLALLENACPAQLATNHPIRVDENGWQYRAASDDFWMMIGYTAGNWTNQCGWATRADWEAAGGGDGMPYRWTDAGGWTKSPRSLVTPKPGFVDRVWVNGESHCRRWYYDSGADKMIAAPYGNGAPPFFDALAVAVQIMDCSGVDQYKFVKYRADRCSNGQGGNTALTPDGRPIIDTTMGAIGMWLQ